MRSKTLQVKLAVDMLVVCVILMSDLDPLLKIGFGLCMFDYTMLCSERIDKLQKEKK